MTKATLPASTRVAAVHLQVKDLARSLAFYGDLLGFQIVGADGHDAWLSASADAPTLLRLTARADATPRPPRATGLFHVAYRAPDRAGLGRWLHRLLSTETPLQGASDHGVSEALYLADPDGLGVELYCDRPRERWAFRGKYVAMTSDPLDTADLLAQAKDQPWNGVDAATDVGHVHLCVSSLEAAEHFYVDTLGMEATQRDFPGALFLAAGGYHHHIGANTWRSAGSPPAHDDAVGLCSFTLEVPGATVSEVAARAGVALGAADSTEVNAEDEELQLQDEDGIAVHLRAR